MIAALGLDLGHRRIGVAGCDRLGLCATGLMTLRRTSFARDIEQLRQLVVEREIEVLVVGMPYALDGSFGPQAQRTQKLARRIGAALNRPIEFMDERFTSCEAEAMLQTQHLSPSRHRELIDRKAACLILQQWLDQRRQTANSRERIGTHETVPFPSKLADS